MNELQLVTARRLEDDARGAELDAVESKGRMEVKISRLGRVISAIYVLLRRVRTAFRDDDGEVVFHRRDVAIEFDPWANADGGGALAYPFIRPHIRVTFPGLPSGLSPFLAGLAWIDGARIARELETVMRLQGGVLPSEALSGLIPGMEGFGVPCTHRGPWLIDYNLAYLIRQIYRLIILFDRRMYDPKDCMTPESATWFLERPHLVPLDDDPIRCLLPGAAEPPTVKTRRFRLEAPR